MRSHVVVLHYCKKDLLYSRRHYLRNRRQNHRNTRQNQRNTCQNLGNIRKSWVVITKRFFWYLLCQGERSISVGGPRERKEQNRRTKRQPQRLCSELPFLESIWRTFVQVAGLPTTAPGAHAHLYVMHIAFAMLEGWFLPARRGPFSLLHGKGPEKHRNLEEAGAKMECWQKYDLPQD